MYKVLLVEDEPLVRIALKSLVEWKKHGFNLEFEASNGKRALELIRDHSDIDMIITDINMPIMDGITLIKEVKKMDINPAILVLSAYDDYNLVREAFKLGIYDYILKTEMEPDKILKLLMTVMEERKDEKKDEKKDRLLEGIDKNKILKDLLKEEKREEEIKKYDLRLGKQNICSCCLLIDDFKSIEERYKNDTLKSFTHSVVNTISQVLSEMDMGEVTIVSPEEYVLLLSFQSNSLLFIRNQTNEILKKIRYLLENYLNIKITAGVSEIVDGYEHIPKLYKDGEKNARLRFLFGKGRNIYPENRVHFNKIKTGKEKNLLEAIPVDGEMAFCELEKLLMIKEKEKGLSQALKLMDKEQSFDELEKLLGCIEKFEAERIEDLYLYYVEIVLMIINHMIEVEKDHKTIHQHTEFFERIISFETKDEIDIWIKKLLEDCMDSILDNRSETSCIIKRAQQFIMENYMKKITLERVSEHVGLSEAYFSKLFTNETNENFTAYLTKIRIEKAKELLIQSNMKIYEICECIGYVNVEHFSRMFKKITGLSPKQFKRKK